LQFEDSKLFILH